MSTQGTHLEQAKQRTNTLGHALMELKNSFLGLFTQMAQGDGTMQLLVDGFKWLAGNLGTIVGVIGKVVRAWLTYQAALKTIQAYQWAMDGGFQKLGRTIMAQIPMTRAYKMEQIQLARAQKQAGDAAIQGGQAATRAGRMIQAIPWMMIIGMLIEVATHWYDVASGAAEARRQAELTQQQENRFQVINDRNASKRAKNLANELADLQRKRNEGKLTEIEFRKQSEATTKKYKDQASNSRKSTQEQIKDLQELSKWAAANRKKEKDGTLDYAKEYDKMNKLYEKMGYDSGTAWFGLLENANKSFADLDVQIKAHLSGLNSQLATQNDEIDGLDQQYLDAKSSVNSYGVEIADNTGKIKNNVKEIKEYQTALSAVNDYLEQTIALTQTLNEIYQDREVAKLTKQIDDIVTKASEEAKSQGIVMGVQLQSTDNIDDFDKTYDANLQKLISSNTELNAKIQEKFELEKKIAAQRLEYAKQDLDRQNEIDKAKEYNALLEERDKLLSQEGIGQKDKDKINADFAKKQAQLAIENAQRDADVVLKKKALDEKYADDVVKIEDDKVKTIEDANRKVLDGYKDYVQKKSDANKKATDDEIEKEKKKQETIQGLIKATFDFFKKKSDERIAQLDKEIAAAEKQQSALETLAANGNINAQQSLAENQKIIDEANKKKEQELKRQKRMELVQTALTTYSNKVGEGVENPLMETIKDITLLQAFINALPAFESGIEDTGSNGMGVDGKGGFHAILHPNERVIPKTLNEKIGNMSNQELARIAQEHQAGKIIGNAQTKSSLDFALLVSEIKDLKSVIANKPETNIELGEITQSAMEIVKTTRKGNSLKFDRFKVRK
jgi:hypothetical protein